MKTLTFQRHGRHIQECQGAGPVSRSRTIQMAQPAIQIQDFTRSSANTENCTSSDIVAICGNESLRNVKIHSKTSNDSDVDAK